MSKKTAPKTAPKREKTAEQKNAETIRRREQRQRAAERKAAALIVPNPWLIDAEVRVAPDAGVADRDVTGRITAVEEGGPQHIVTVHLRNGRVVKFLSSQLVLV